jgi:enoyl-CoA hydratase
MGAVPTYTTLKLQLDGPVADLRLHRPEAANALDSTMWDEIPQALSWLSQQNSVRVAVISGEGKHFCAGIDVAMLADLFELTADASRPTRGRESLLAFIEHAQAGFNAIEQARMPVIAAIHGACIGGAVDLIAACDVRLCSSDARFSIKEVDLAVVPDVGTLQRLRHVISHAAVAELSLTAETFNAERALSLGLVSRICEDKAAVLATAGDLARQIAAKSPATVRGIKRNLLWARDHSVRDGLAYTAAWNSAMLVGEDLREAVAAFREKRLPRFED